MRYPLRTDVTPEIIDAYFKIFPDHGNEEAANNFRCSESTVARRKRGEFIKSAGRPRKSQATQTVKPVTVPEPYVRMDPDFERKNKRAFRKGRSNLTPADYYPRTGEPTAVSCFLMRPSFFTQTAKDWVFYQNVRSLAGADGWTKLADLREKAHLPKEVSMMVYCGVKEGWLERIYK
jgi:hypothetical protein